MAYHKPTSLDREFTVAIRWDVCLKDCYQWPVCTTCVGKTLVEYADSTIFGITITVGMNCLFVEIFDNHTTG